MSSPLSDSSFSSCENCETIITQFSYLYHEMKCLELQLFWKLESLGKVMNLADEVAVSTKIEVVKTGFANEEKINVSHSFNAQPNLNDFRTFRTKIIEKCKLDST